MAFEKDPNTYSNNDGSDVVGWAMDNAGRAFVIGALILIQALILLRGFGLL